MQKSSLNKTSLTCAVVGLGVGEQHAATLLQNPQSELKYISDINDQKINDFCKRYTTSAQPTTFDRILKDQDIDLICIASYDDAHSKQIMQSLEYGKHIFVEKPLCQTKEQLTDILGKSKTKRLGIKSNLVLRKAPLFSWLAAIIKAGDLGEIYSFDGDYLYGRIHKITKEWRKDVDNYSVMEGGGIHIIDLMLMLTSQKPIKVHSTANKITTQNTAFRYHDFHSSMFYFESGLIGRITANFGCVHKHQHAFRIFGTKGTFIYDDMGPRIHWSHNPEKQPEMIQLATNPVSKGALIPDFIESILQNSFHHYAQREFELMSVVLAADEALNYNEPLTVEYLA